MNKVGSVDIRTTHFVWNVNDFDNIRTKVGEHVESSIFTASEMGPKGVKFQLSLYPAGEIYEIEISYGFYLWGNESRLSHSTTMLGLGNSSIECLKFKLRAGDEIHKHLYKWKGTLKIACSIDEIIAYSTNKVCQSIESIESFHAIFLSDDFSDVTIEVDGKQLKAHRNILAARSEVFLAMLTHNTVERNENIIRIEDFSYDVMKEVLRFIYCGTVENLQAHKEDLLAAADKYNLIFLKNLCGQSIWASMKADHIWEILNMSDLYNCYELKANAVKYLADNLQKAVTYPGFKEVSESNPSLIGELLRDTAMILKIKNCKITTQHSCLEITTE